MIDLTTTDSFQIISQDQYEFIDPDEYNNLHSQVFNQIESFNNLGNDLLKDNNNINIKRKLFTTLIEYADDNYLNITDIDNILISNIFIDEIGYYIYLFLSVDCYNSIFPNFIKICQISSINQFEKYIQTNEYITIKNKLLKSIRLIIEPLIKLQNLDPSVTKDLKYQAFLKRLTYHIDLLDYGHPQKFIENYMLPVFRKNFTGLIWRAS